MPDDFVIMQAPPDFENDSDFRPSRAVCRPQIHRLCRQLLRISLADYVQLSFRRIHTAANIRHPYHHVSCDSRFQKTPSVARVRSPKTCATTVLRIPSYA